MPWYRSRRWWLGKRIGTAYGSHPPPRSCWAYPLPLSHPQLPGETLRSCLLWEEEALQAPRPLPSWSQQAMISARPLSLTSHLFDSPALWGHHHPGPPANVPPFPRRVGCRGTGPEREVLLTAPPHSTDGQDASRRRGLASLWHRGRIGTGPCCGAVTHSLGSSEDRGHPPVERQPGGGSQPSAMLGLGTGPGSRMPAETVPQHECPLAQQPQSAPYSFMWLHPLILTPRASSVAVWFPALAPPSGPMTSGSSLLSLGFSVFVEAEPGL